MTNIAAQRAADEVIRVYVENVTDSEREHIAQIIAAEYAKEIQEARRLIEAVKVFSPSPGIIDDAQAWLERNKE